MAGWVLCPGYQKDETRLSPHLDAEAKSFLMFIRVGDRIQFLSLWPISSLVSARGLHSSSVMVSHPPDVLFSHQLEETPLLKVPPDGARPTKMISLF